MLKSIRKHSKHPVAKIFLGLVLIAFAGLGLGSFVPSLQFNRDYIKAGDTSIEIQEIANQFNKLRSEVAPDLTINEAVTKGYLDLLITYLSNEAIILEEASKQKITVTREHLKKTLLENEAFLDDDGKFSPTKFEMSLFRAGVSEEKYLELLGRDIIKKQITETISESAKISEKIIFAIAEKNLEKRNGTIVDLDLVPLSTIRKPSDNELKTFYDNTTSSWIEPARRSGKYFILDPKDYADTITLSAQELIDEFDIRRKDYFKEETRSINQIIFDDKSKAEKFLSDLSNETQFNKLAKDKYNNENSIIDDIKKGDLLNEISTVVFNLKTNEVSDIIKTDLGYHVIKVEKIIPATDPKFEDIKLELEKDVRLDLATDIIYDIANFADDAFSSGSSIDVVANEKNLELFSTDYLDKNGLDVNRSKPKNNLLSDKVFLEVLWNSEKDGNLSINETEDGKFFALSLFDEKKEFLPSLDEVKTKLEVSWKQSKAIEETLNKAGKLSAADDFIKFANENNMKISEVKGVSQNDVSYPRPEIVKTLFNINKLNEKQIAATELGISVVRFDDAIKPEVEDVKNLEKLLLNPFNQSLKSDISSALISELSEKHELEVNKSLILQALGLNSP